MSGSAGFGCSRRTDLACQMLQILPCALQPCRCRLHPRLVVSRQLRQKRPPLQTGPRDELLPVGDGSGHVNVVMDLPRAATSWYMPQMM